MQLRTRLTHYACLIRLHKPIGILLLLWPTLWALWLASDGWPDTKILFVFVAGTILMRSAGCILNDLADRHVDGHVQRTKQRPLVDGTVTTTEAFCLAGVLSLAAFLFVLLCNMLTIMLAVIGASIIILYPFLKRVTHLPQLGLGVAFSWGVPMAFAAVTGEVGLFGWFLFLTCIIWPVIYDTMYAMVDRDDDLQIGIKSTAILFGLMDRIIIGLLQTLFIVMLVIVGIMFHVEEIFYVCVAIAAGLFVYQQWLIKDRDRDKCFKAFLNNNWVGLVIFIGVYFQ
jgi:4-hydroxybenzoate polyprenyltransferase